MSVLQKLVTRAGSDTDAARLVAFTTAYNGPKMLKFLASAGGGRAPDSAEACVAFFKRAYAARVQPFSIRHNPQRALRDLCAKWMKNDNGGPTVRLGAYGRSTEACNRASRRRRYLKRSR